MADLKERAAVGLRGVVSLALALGAIWGVIVGYEWAAARVSERRCVRALSDVLERNAPELGARVDHCTANSESVHGGDLCFVNILDDGVRKTHSLRLSCSRMVRGDPAQIADIFPRR